MSEKSCRKCGNTRPIENFRADRRCPGGRVGVCQDCVRTAREFNPARVRKEYEDLGFVWIDSPRDAPSGQLLRWEDEFRIKCRQLCDRLGAMGRGEVRAALRELEELVESSGSVYNRRESACKKILERLFPGREFRKVRHRDFINPTTGRRLELDLYNAELRLALEYNGPQHYYRVDHWQTEQQFEEQKTRDLIKENYCQIYDIKLIIVPNLGEAELEEFIGKSCAALAVVEPSRPSQS
jgi:hypothetical protein